MEEVTNNSAQPRVIDLAMILKRIKQNSRLILFAIVIAFVLSVIIILPVPRYYTTVTRVAPEVESAGGAGAISSIAASFGFDLGDAMSSTDAISPLLYPDLMADNGFVSTLFDIQVTNCDGSISTNYYDYMANCQEYSIWKMIGKFFVSLIPKSKVPEIKKGENDFNPYVLDKKQSKVMTLMRDNIKLDYDKKTSIISIEVTAQDRLICKTLADSVRSRLMTFITEYRTSKARTDVEYYQSLSDEALAVYVKARRDYGGFYDANTDITLPSMQGKLDDLENDMQLKYNTYTALQTQLQAARTKLQERTPAFTVLQGAEVPLKPAGPKRMIFVAAMCFLAFFGCVVYSMKDEILR